MVEEKNQKVEKTHTHKEVFELKHRSRSQSHIFHQMFLIFLIFFPFQTIFFNKKIYIKSNSTHLENIESLHKFSLLISQLFTKKNRIKQSNFREKKTNLKCLTAWLMQVDNRKIKVKLESMLN